MTAARGQSLDIEALFSDLEAARGVVAAVSGGPDSTALMHALARWASAAGRPPVVVATVDHGLRPGSAEEAASVEAAAAALGLSHRTLTWEGPKPRTRVQERARVERYRRLAALAGETGASHIATGHTLDDQAETVVMRLIAGSGVAGLAGMRTSTICEGVLLVRPFLALPKARLVELCRAEGWAFLQDPSNADPRFGRARLRAGLMPLLAREGLTAERLGALARRAGRDADALLARAEEVFAQTRLEARDGGGLVLDGRRLAAEPDAVLLRVVAMALAATAGAKARTVRLERLEERVLGDLRPALEGGRARRLNLGGVLVDLEVGGRLALSPEPPRKNRAG